MHQWPAFGNLVPPDGSELAEERKKSTGTLLPQPGLSHHVVTFHTASNCLLYRVAGCPLFRGCLSIEVNGRTVRTFRIVRCIMGVRFSGVSVKRGSTAVTKDARWTMQGLMEPLFLNIVQQKKALKTQPHCTQQPDYTVPCLPETYRKPLS